MSSFVATLIVLASMGAGTLLGSLLRRRLPDAHLRDDSKDVVKTASGMIATLVALVIGLLVSWAKSSFDQANAGITEMGARIITLDRLLGRYGPEAAPIRGRLREAGAAGGGRVWPAGPGAAGRGGEGGAGRGRESEGAGGRSGGDPSAGAPGRGEPLHPGAGPGRLHGA